MARPPERAARRPQPARAQPQQLHQRLLAQRPRHHGAVRSAADRQDGGEETCSIEVIKKFAAIDLSPDRVDNVQMGYVFEELIRIGAEQSNEEAGEHFTPREVIKLMVNLLLSPEKDLARSHVVKTIYDPACGTGGMLSVAEKYIRDLNADASPSSSARTGTTRPGPSASPTCSSRARTPTTSSWATPSPRTASTATPTAKWTFDYMLANPPFGVEWKQQQRYIEHERDTLGFSGRFGAGTPRVNDGALLFLQHMLAKMRAPRTAAAASPSSSTARPSSPATRRRREQDPPLDHRERLAGGHRRPARAALLQHRHLHLPLGAHQPQGKASRKGKVQLIDARPFWVQMEKSLGNNAAASAIPPTRKRTPTTSATSPKSSETSRTARPAPSPRKTPSPTSRSRRSASSARSSTTRTSATTRSPSSARCG
jgi:type I restriction enzyme M protein